MTSTTPQSLQAPPVIYIPQIASQNTVEKRFMKEIKSGIRDQSVSRSVRILQIISIILGIILLVIDGNLYENGSYSVHVGEDEYKELEEHA